jgi:aconitase B
MSSKTTGIHSHRHKTGKTIHWLSYWLNGVNFHPLLKCLLDETLSRVIASFVLTKIVIIFLFLLQLLSLADSLIFLVHA